MSRSGYCEGDDYDYDPWLNIIWRGAVARAMNGKRGQALLRETLAALDAMPEKKLIASELEGAEGSFCTLGALGHARGIDMSAIDPEEADQVAAAFGVAPAMVREIVYYNDEVGPFKESPEARFQRMRRWVESQIREPKVIP